MSRYRIGRADTNDIVLADATVSREHAELVELGGGRFQIRDLGSTYGVSIWQGEGWQKVAEIELRHDSRLRIGDHKTTVADLLRDMDRTVVRPRASEAPREATAPPAAAAPPLPPEAPAVSAPPAEPPAVPDDDATAPPAARTAPAAPKPAPAPPRRAPPRPAAPRPAALPFQFLRDLPPEKRILVWLGLGFAGFLLIALITLVLALAL